MKWTKKTWLFFALQLIFILIVPCVLVWMQYGGAELSTKYRVSVTSIMLFALIFLIAKRLIFTPWLKKINGQLAQIEVDHLTVTAPEAIASLKKRYRALAVFQLLTNAIMPLLVLVMAILTVKVVQDGLIKLYGVLMFSTISTAVGVLCKLGEVYSVRCEHEK
jgi:hypothetical protein